MKEWFILIKQKEMGPYSIKQLRYHPDATPDTLARKKEWTSWKKIKEIAELNEIFEDSQTQEQSSKAKKIEGKEELALNHSMEPNRVLFWLTVAILIIIYLYTLFNKKWMI